MPSHDFHVSVDPLGASKDMHGSGSKVHWSYFFFFGFSSYTWALAIPGSFRPASTSCAFYFEPKTVLDIEVWS